MGRRKIPDWEKKKQWCLYVTEEERRLCCTALAPILGEARLTTGSASFTIPLESPTLLRMADEALAEYHAGLTEEWPVLDEDGKEDEWTTRKSS